MAVVRQAGREWWAIVKGVRRLALRELNLALKCIDFFP